MSDPYAWTFDPGVIVALIVYTAIYVWRWRAVRAQEGPRGASRWRLASWLAGIATLAVALISPVDRLAEELFVMHMIQHVLLIDVAAILLVLGLTKVLLRPVTRRVQALERAAGPFAHPAFAVVAYVATLTAWHFAALYQLALEHAFWHAVEHLSFLAAGLLFWWHLLSPIRSRRRLGGLGPIAYISAAKILTGLLGLAITFAPEVLYPYYAQRPRLWGLSALDDQGAAGLTMAFEESMVMIAALFAVFAKMIADSDAEQRRQERFGAA